MSALNLPPEPEFEPGLVEFWFRKNQLLRTLSATFRYVDEDDDDIDDDLDESLDDIHEGRSLDEEPPQLLLGRAAMVE
jgi:hypothetical protein